MKKCESVSKGSEKYLLSSFHEKFLKGFVLDQNYYSKSNLLVNDAAIKPVQLRKNRTELSMLHFENPIDYDKWIQDYSSLFDYNNWFKTFTIKNCFPNIRTYSYLLKKEERHLLAQGRKLQPNRMLLVLHVKQHTHSLVTLINDPKMLNELIKSKFDDIDSIDKASQFIDEFGLAYPESVYSTGPFNTLEIYLQSFKLNCEQLYEIGMNLMQKLQLDADNSEIIENGFKIDHEDCKIKLFTLKSRLGIEETWTNQDKIDYNMRIFQRQTTEWKLVYDILDNLLLLETNKVGKSLLKFVSVLRYFNFKLKNWSLTEFIDKSNNNTRFDVIKYWDEVIFREASNYFFQMEAKSPGEYYIKNYPAKTFDYFKELIMKNEIFFQVYMKKNMFFLDSTECLNEFLFRHRNFRNVLIFHDQNLIIHDMPEQFKHICDNLEQLNILNSKFETNIVLIDYNIHRSDKIFLKEDQKIFKKCIHITVECPAIESIFFMTFLSDSLNVTFCQLPGIPSLSNLTGNMQEFDLSKNYVINVDVNNFDGKGNSKSLQRLYLNNNWIVNFDMELILSLKNLFTLDLSSNFLRGFRNRFHDFSECMLTHLDLSNNKITSLESNTFYSLNNLEVLSLSSNFLTTVSTHIFSNLTSLKILMLDKNQITNIDLGAFRNLSKLELLQLDHNKIMFPRENLFENLKELKCLNLSYNKIISLPIKIFSNLEELEKLHLQNNCLASLEKDLFRTNLSLNVVFLQSNKISYLEAETFKYLINLEVLFVYENSLPINFNYESMKKQMVQLKYFCFSHDKSKLRDLFLYEKIKKYLNKKK